MNKKIIEILTTVFVKKSLALPASVKCMIGLVVS